MGDVDDELEELPEDASVLGGTHRKVDGYERVTGTGIYTDDIQLPGMLHGKILRSPHAHARIVSIDAQQALALPGVHAVVTGKDFQIPYGVLPWTPDENALAVDKVCYVGDGVACVAAESEELAISALAKIHVEYEVLTPIFDPVEALAATDNVINPYSKKGNLSKDVALSFGDVDGEFERAHLVVEGDYFFHGTTHGAIEPHCAVGRADRTGVTVWSSTQVPHYLHRILAQVLEMPARAIRVIQPFLGGAFGGKSEPFDLELCVAKLAMITGRPVKILYTREEVFYAHRGRHPMHMSYRMGFNKEGAMMVLDGTTVLDGGAYSSFGLATSYYSGQLAVSPYEMQAFRFHSRRAYTNKPACGPKRGHGSVQPRFAIEVQIDKAATALGIDPIEMRKRNALPPDTRTINEFLIGSTGFVECLDRVADASQWARRSKLGHGHGMGVAGSSYICGTNYCVYPNDMPQAAVDVALDRSGRARIYTGASDIGQGSNTMVAVIVCQELGLALEDVRVLAADTDLCPVDLGAYSSRITLMVGNACLTAARALRRKVARAVAKRWEVRASRVVLAERQAIDREDPSRAVDIATAFQWAEADLGMLSESGSYDTPKDRHGSYRGAPIGASPAYSFTAHIAEVRVDSDTGEINIVKFWVAHDCGRAISKRLVEGQIEGSTYMGAAEALMEHHAIGDTGLHLGPSLLDYRMPTSLDVPEIEAIIVEAPDARGPYGAKEAGEGPLHSSIPAIANAVYDAVGIRLDSLPFTPDVVCRALDARADAEAAGTLAPHKPGRSC